MQLVQDEHNNGAIMEVCRGKGGNYRRRQLVDMDGVSNPVTVDNLTKPSQSVKPGSLGWNIFVSLAVAVVVVVSVK